MRLHVGVVGLEQRFGALDGERLDDVDELAAAVVTAARIALRVFVGQDRAGGFENRVADEVFRRDQLEALGLARRFVLNGTRDVGIRVGKRALHYRGRDGVWHE